MTHVSQSEAYKYVSEIQARLERNGRHTIFFTCSRIYPSPVDAGKASTALAGYLLNSGGRLGRYKIQVDKKQGPHGVRWKAVAVG